MKRMAFLVMVTLVPAALCVAQQAAPPGRSIQGTLRGDNGTVLAGGNILLHRLHPYPELTRKTQWTAVSDSKGGFRFSNLPAGQFRLCVSVAAKEWLNPCEWGSTPLPLSIRDVLIETPVSLVMKKGVRVPVRVEDSGNLMSLHEGKTSGAHLLLGVQNDAGVFTPASVKSVDTAGRIYELVVPPGTQAALAVNSRFFRLNDGTGKALAIGVTSKFPLAPYASEIPGERRELKLTITGGEQSGN